MSNLHAFIQLLQRNHGEHGTLAWSTTFSPKRSRLFCKCPTYCCLFQSESFIAMHWPDRILCPETPTSSRPSGRSDPRHQVPPAILRSWTWLSGSVWLNFHRSGRYWDWLTDLTVSAFEESWKPRLQDPTTASMKNSIPETFWKWMIMDDIIESALVPVEFNASNAVGSEYVHLAQTLLQSNLPPLTTQTVQLQNVYEPLMNNLTFKNATCHHPPSLVQ